MRSSGILGNYCICGLKRLRSPTGRSDLSAGKRNGQPFSKISRRRPIGALADSETIILEGCVARSLE
jgi:hypothetical protein